MLEPHDIEKQKAEDKTAPNKVRDSRKTKRFGGQWSAFRMGQLGRSLT